MANTKYGEVSRHTQYTDEEFQEIMDPEEGEYYQYCQRATECEILKNQ